MTANDQSKRAPDGRFLPGTTPGPGRPKRSTPPPIDAATLRELAAPIEVADVALLYLISNATAEELIEFFTSRMPKPTRETISKA